MIGKYVKIVSMMGEPQYSGKIGRIEHVDSTGQLHGTWGGLAIQPEHDTFTVLTDEEVTLIRMQKEKEELEYMPPFIANATKVEVPFSMMQVLSRLEKLNGAIPKRVECKVILDLNGNVDVAHKVKRNTSLVMGVADCDVERIRTRIFRNVGQCCFKCEIRPFNVRKNLDVVLPVIDKACVIAIARGVKGKIA